MAKSNQVVPHNEVKGIDICGSNGSKFIIRSDLNCFFEVRFFSQCDDPIIIHPLHPNFMYGDHYLASDSFANYASPYRPRRRWKHTEPIKRRSLLGGTCRSSPVSSDDSESVLGVPVLYRSLSSSNTPTRYRSVPSRSDQLLEMEVEEPVPMFYVIKGKELIKVRDLSTTSGTSLIKLHQKCQGGKFYFMAQCCQRASKIQSQFYIIDGDNNCMQVNDMSEDGYNDKDTIHFKLHEMCRNGIYYCATGRCFYILKQVDRCWGLQYHRTENLRTDANGETVTIDSPVTDLLPGGLAVCMGSANGKWTLLVNETRKTCLDDTQGLRKQSCKFNIKVGFDAENCSLSGEEYIGEDKALSLFKSQLLLSECYGGCRKDFSMVGWKQEITVQKELEIQPGESVYIWQYIYTMGNLEILRTQHTTITTTLDTPTEGTGKIYLLGYS